ncbi:hypothetical protein SOM61_22740 [Massilia sp. CFBP9012]|uniref:hypothetical protein n=1 Tax=Massilia sp. CFBP9012 TaxID=3096531 RepID=UPI002A6AE49C|nr:hypothetical protein [Massilia sp. CFBP9012]MDY0977785.1 hypothetical protein [Massilia sp. CFBP9012]
MMATPAQLYFEELVKEHPLPEISIADVEPLCTEIGVQVDRNVLCRDRVGELLAELEPFLPLTVQKMLHDGRLVAGEIGKDAPNAHVIELDNQQYVVVLHSGLFEFLYRIARPLASAVFRSSDDQQDQQGIDFPELARVVAEAFWWLKQTGSSFGPEYPIAVEQKILASLVATNAERFLLAHEIGHVIFALGKDQSGVADQFTDADEEHFADHLALQFTLSAGMEDAKRNDAMSLMLTYAGAELALQIWGVMEQIGLLFVDGVHPPTSERIAMLRRSLRDQCESEQIFDSIVMPAVVIERAFNEVAQIIVSPGTHAPIYEAQAASLLNDLERLLETCADNPIPDYYSFYTEMPALLSHGYPEVVLIQVFSKVAENFSELCREGKQIADQTDAIKRLNRYKLLLGLSENLPEPAKSLYGASIRQAMLT